MFYFQIMSKSIPDCGVCFTRHISKVSNIWCSECGEGLCLSGEQHHRASKSTRHHVTVPIEEYRKLPVFIREIKEICEKHDEKYEMFCKSHDCRVVENASSRTTKNVKMSSSLKTSYKMLRPRFLLMTYNNN